MCKEKYAEFKVLISYILIAFAYLNHIWFLR